MLLRLAYAIDALTEAVGSLSRLLVLLVVAVGFYNVVARYSGRYLNMQLSSNVFIELQWYLFSMIFFLAFAYILKHNVNVRVDFLYARWGARPRALVDFLGTVFFLIPFCILGINATIKPVMLSWGQLPDGSFGTWEVSPDPNGLPRAPIKSMIIVAFALLLLQALSHAIKSLAILSGHLEVAQIAAEEFQPNQPPAEI